MNNIKRRFALGIALLLALLAAISCNNSKNIKTLYQNGETQYQHWVCQAGEHAGAEIVFARMGDVFRGEYIDPGFQDFTSVPIMGTIDEKGNVEGVSGAILPEGNIMGKLSGRITGNKFQATWLPTPTAISMFREMDMKLKKLSPKMEEEIGKHPKAFYNILYPEQTRLINASDSRTISRITPFLPEPLVSDRTYGYGVGEWETRTIHITKSSRKGEADFHLHIEMDGQNTMKADIKGSAPIDGNTFRYNEKGYEFEVAVYTDFVTIKTIAGTIDLNGRKGTLKADGVYPAPVEQPFYVGDGLFSGDEPDEDFAGDKPNDPVIERITNDILNLPEMKIENASVMLVGEPSDEEPYYTIKGGSNMETHFATSYWFHVYTKPKYEIKVYDIVMDDEISLDEWRNSKLESNY